MEYTTDTRSTAREGSHQTPTPDPASGPLRELADALDAQDWRRAGEATKKARKAGVSIYYKRPLGQGRGRS